MAEDHEETVVTEQDEIETEEAMKVLDVNRKFVEDKLKESTKWERRMKRWRFGKWMTDPEGFKRTFFKDSDFGVKDHEALMRMRKTFRMKYEIMVAKRVFCQRLLDEGSYALLEDLNTPRGVLGFVEKVCRVRDALFFRRLTQKPEVGKRAPSLHGAIMSNECRKAHSSGSPPTRKSARWNYKNAI